MILTFEDFIKLPSVELLARLADIPETEKADATVIAISLRIIIALEDNARATRELRDEVKNISSSDNERGLTFMLGEFVKRLDSYIEKEYHTVK